MKHRASFEILRQCRREGFSALKHRLGFGAALAANAFPVTACLRRRITNVRRPDAVASRSRRSRASRRAPAAKMRTGVSRHYRAFPPWVFDGRNRSLPRVGMNRAPASHPGPCRAVPLTAPAGACAARVWQRESDAASGREIGRHGMIPHQNCRGRRQMEKELRHVLGAPRRNLHLLSATSDWSLRPASRSCTPGRRGTQADRDAADGLDRFISAGAEHLGKG